MAKSTEPKGAPKAPATPAAAPAATKSRTSWMDFLDGKPSYHGPPKPTFLEVFEVFMVNNLVPKWPKPSFFMVLGAHGSKWLITMVSKPPKWGCSLTNGLNGL